LLQVTHGEGIPIDTSEGLSREKKEVRSHSSL